MYKRLVFLFFLIFIIYTPFAKAINARTIDSIEVEIVKSGTIYSNAIREIELSLYIPQEGIEEIDVFPNNWEFTTDEFGNKMVLIKWKDPSSVETYEIKLRVKNFAKYFENLKREEWEFEVRAKKMTNLTYANEEMEKLAYANESIIEKIGRLNLWVNENIRYKFEELKEITKSAEETFKDREGACGEFSNLLIALLRSQGIPSRFVAGYALSEAEEEKFFAHAWVEVLIEGKWIPFDPTWLEGFYLDATHIKFANLLDSNFREKLTYKGIGEIRWEQNPISFKIIAYTTSMPEIELNIEKEVKAGAALLANASVKGNCQFLKLNLNSCVDGDEKPLFQVFDNTRKLLFCDKENIYWIVFVPQKKTGYICPLNLFDISGVSVTKKVKVRGIGTFPDISLSGPESVKVNEEFYIEAERDGLFFSPNFTTNMYGRKWKLSLPKTGKYKFYFYSANSKGEKNIEVLSVKHFSILEIERPSNVTLGKTFLLNLTLKNFANKSMLPKIEIEFLNQSIKRVLNFNSKEVKKLSFKLVANEKGKQKILIRIKEVELLRYSTTINVVEKELSFFERIFLFLKKLLTYLQIF
jgi:hypothetical protein